MRYIIVILLVSITFSCRQNDPKNIDNSKKEENVNSCKTIILQPFDGFPDTLANGLLAEIRKINPDAVLREPISLPQSAYYQARGRYRADSLISFLWTKAAKDNVVIGLTSKDISATKGKEPDWGIMGLAYSPGHSCVVSTFRLSKKNVVSQLYKLSLHELAHTQGLPHCKRDLACYMSDANGTNPWDAETGFCNFCKTYLKHKGWILN